MSRNRANFQISAEDRTRAAFDSVMGRLNGVQQSVGRLGRVLTSLPAMIAGVAGAAGFGMLIRSSMRSADEIGKLSDQLRTSTEGLIGLQHAAEQSTRGGTALLNNSLERMNVTLAQAARGMGPASQELERLGLNASQLANMRSDEAFRAIADRVSQLDNAVDKTNATYAIFGRSNQEIITLLEQGSAGLDAYQEEADRLGKTLSRVDAAQIEAANDAFARLRDVITGVGQRIAVALAPYMQAISDYLVDAATNGVNFRDVVMDAMERATKAAGLFGNVVRGLQVVFKGVEVIARGFFAAVMTLVDETGNGLRAFLNAFIAAINTVITQVNRIPGVTVDAISEIERGAFGETIAHQADVARMGLIEAREELEALAMQQMPADKVQAFFEAIREGSRKAAEAAVGSRNGPGLFAAEDDGQDERLNTALERERNALQQRIAQIEESHRTEEERLADAFENRLFMLEDAYQRELITKEHKDALIEKEEAAHQAKLNQIVQRNLSEREKFQQLSMRAQVATVSGALADMTAGVSHHSRRMFEINKAAGIANAVINTAQGVTKALATYPPPLSFAMAAAQAAAGYAQIQAIRSSSFGSGAAPSIAGTTPAPPVTNVPPVQQQQQDQQRGGAVTIQFTGDVFGWDDYVQEKVIQGIKDAVRDNDEVIIDRGSRNASELAA